MLRPGGTLVCVDWCDDYLTCKACSWWLRLTDPAFYRTYALSECRILLEQTGFQVVQAKRFRIEAGFGGSPSKVATCPRPEGIPPCAIDSDNPRGGNPPCYWTMCSGRSSKEAPICVMARGTFCNESSTRTTSTTCPLHTDRPTAVHQRTAVLLPGGPNGPSRPRPGTVGACRLPQTRRAVPGQRSVGLQQAATRRTGRVRCVGP